MKIAAIFMLALIVLSATWFLGHADLPESATFYDGPVHDTATFISKLRSAGATVEPNGHLSQEFLTVEGQLLLVNGEDIQVFEYPTSDSAAAEAARISPDGFSIGSSMVSWVSDPHFFQAGRLLAVYVGDTASTIETLENTLGKQLTMLLANS